MKIFRFIIVALAICILTPLPASAEEYVGTFLVGESYSQKNVKVELLPAAETGKVVNDTELIYCVNRTFLIKMKKKNEVL